MSSTDSRSCFLRRFFLRRRQFAVLQLVNRLVPVGFQFVAEKADFRLEVRLNRHQRRMREAFVKVFADERARQEDEVAVNQGRQRPVGLISMRSDGMLSGSIST